MSTLEAKFTLSKLCDIEASFAFTNDKKKSNKNTSVLYVQITCLQTGQELTSSPLEQPLPTSSGSNDCFNYQLDPPCTLSFNIDSWIWRDGVDFDVKIITKVDNNKKSTQPPIYYSCRGNIHYDSSEEEEGGGGSGTSTTCILYENGNWKYPQGTLEYSLVIVEK